MITYRDDRLPESTNAILSCRLDYTQMGGEKPLEQITNNLVLIEKALQDKEHIGENLQEILRVVNSLKTFGISSLIKKSCYDLSEDGLHDLPDELRYNLTAADCEQVISIVGNDSLGNRKTR